MLKLDFLASFLIIFLTDLFLMLPDANVDEDEVEVPDTAPLFTEEDVPDGIFLSPAAQGNYSSALVGPGCSLIPLQCSVDVQESLLS